MAINYSRLFTTLGLCCGALNELNTFRGTTLGTTRKNTLVTQLKTNAVYDSLVSTVAPAAEEAQTAMDSWVESLQTLAQSALISEVILDRPLLSESLDAAVTELVRQMTNDAQSLNDSPCNITVGNVGVPVGDHVFVFGEIDPATGKESDFIVPDVLLIECSADRSNGGTAYAETFTVTGKPADQLPTDAEYPSGSGFSTSINAIDPAEDGGLITDPGFDGAWTATNTPPSPWVIRAGVAGTHIFQATDGPRGGTGASLGLVGDGSVIPRVVFPVTLTPFTAYTVHARIKKILDPGTDWAVSLILTDGAGNIVTGPASYANVVSSAAATSVAADWTNTIKGVIICPKTIPATGLFLEIRFHASGNVATAPVATASVRVDYVACVESSPIYPGGPTMQAFSGITEGVIGDQRTATIALAAGSIGQFLIRGLDRLLGLATLSSRIPTVSSGETVSDALVV